jgi:hypothetical protein
LSDQGKEKKKRRTFFYDVDRFLQVHAETQHTRGRFSRILGRVTGAFSSMEGFFVMMLPPLIIFGMVFLIVYGLFLGPFVFLSMVAAGLVGITVIVERRGGGGENFHGHDFWKSMIGQIVGCSLAAGLVLLLLFLGRMPLPHIGF